MDAASSMVVFFRFQSKLAGHGNGVIAGISSSASTCACVDLCAGLERRLGRCSNNNTAEVVAWDANFARSDRGWKVLCPQEFACAGGGGVYFDEMFVASFFGMLNREFCKDEVCCLDVRLQDSSDFGGKGY